MPVIFKLFLSFLQVGLFSVGGGYAAIPLIQNQIVNVWHLMTIEEFADLITIAEMTPGPISINLLQWISRRPPGKPQVPLPAQCLHRHPAHLLQRWHPE